MEKASYVLTENSNRSLDKSDVNYELLDKITLQDCRKVEEEFSKELKELEALLANPDFGIGPNTIGSELELALINKDNYMPAMVNVEICDAINSKNVNTEISKFCLEYNGSIISPTNNPLATLAYDLESSLYSINKVANEKFNTKLVPIGILPSLTTKDLGMDALTPYWRYHSIDKLLRSLRCNRDFCIDIDGEDPLELKWYNTVLEGVNTSYQVHLRVNPTDFNNYYNAAQLASAFVLAVSGNSPLLFGHRLWSETRIPIFEQTVNNHNIHPGSWQEQNRVSFGRGWIKDGLLGLFKENCELYYPIFPIISEVEKFTKPNLGPELLHLKQHNSSIWTWNRAVYDPIDGGHFRIEMRYLPAGPSVKDMVANTGFMLGLTKAFTHNIEQFILDYPFKYAQYNFYQAAQLGLDAHCIWQVRESKTLKEVDIVNLLNEMLDLAVEGLQELGATALEAHNMRSCIKDRVAARQTGAEWQKHVYNKLLKKHGMNTSDALKIMLKSYVGNQETNLPVANWTSTIF